MKPTYHIINVNLTCVTTDEVIEDVPCNGCAKCCEILAPYLSPEEIASGLYPISLIQPSAEQLQANPNIGPTITLYRKKEGGCGMYVNKQCTIYDHRPLSCRQFDCRKGHYPALVDHALEYFKGQ